MDLDLVIPSEFFGLKIIWTEEAYSNDEAASQMYYEELAALCRT